MNWYKVKSVLIVLFLLINVFLISFNVLNIRKEQQISDKAVDNVIKVLENYNIKIDEALIEREVPALDNLIVRNILGNEAKFLGKVLGTNYTKEENTFFRGTKSVTIEKNKFTIRDKTVVSTLEEAEAWLEENGIDVGDTLKTRYMDTFFFRTVYEGYEVFGSELQVKCDGEYTAASGVIFTPVKDEEGSGIKHVTSVLPYLIRDGLENAVITEIITGYMCDPLPEGGFAEATASPTYKVITLDGREFFLK